MSKIISQDPKIILQDHPFDLDMKVAVSQVLDGQREQSLCRNCAFRAQQYKDCEIATLLFDLAKQTGVSTLVRWCPNFSLQKF